MTLPLRSLRLPDETDQQFRQRAERTPQVARVLVTACLNNHDIQDLIADANFPSYTEDGCSRSPTVRIDYAEAFAIAGIGEGLAVTKSKHWGDGPNILPLEPDDPVLPHRIQYIFKRSSRYNRRFHQRKRFRRLLGRHHRPLVSKAMYLTKRNFLLVITPDQAQAIRYILGLEPGQFWRAAKGKVFLPLPPRLTQLELDFGD